MQLLFSQPQQPDIQDRPAQIGVPFLREPIGLGDVIANLTKAAGVKPCGGCQKRQEALNRTVRLNPYR